MKSPFTDLQRRLQVDDLASLLAAAWDAYVASIETAMDVMAMPDGGPAEGTYYAELRRVAGEFDIQMARVLVVLDSDEGRLLPSIPKALLVPVSSLSRGFELLSSVHSHHELAEALFEAPPLDRVWAAIELTGSRAWLRDHGHELDPPQLRLRLGDDRDAPPEPVTEAAPERAI